MKIPRPKEYGLHAQFGKKIYTKAVYRDRSPQAEAYPGTVTNRVKTKTTFHNRKDTRGAFKDVGEYYHGPQVKVSERGVAGAAGLSAAGAGVHFYRHDHRSRGTRTPSVNKGT